MTIRLDKGLYSKDTLLKTAYSFTSDYFIHLDSEEKCYVVEIKSKTGTEEPKVEDLFCNELINQATRELISEKTKTIRELILARSFASTIVNENEFITEESEIDTENVFMDWFDKNESD